MDQTIRFVTTSDGDKLADALDYVPLPDTVTAQIRGTWKAQIKDPAGKPVWVDAR